MKTTIILLSIALIFALINWWKRYVSCAAITYFMVKKGIQPTDEELEECTRIVVKKIFKIE